MILLDRLQPYLNNENDLSAIKNYSTDTIKTAARLLGNPQLSYKTIHIAGTNGKGSAAHYIERLISLSGKKCGIYSSPHLNSPCERIKINQTMISTDQAIALLSLIENCCDTSCLSWFDMMTLIAFLYFKNAKVEYAVIECGLGGRLDSTSIITPEAVVITSISLDHTAILGSNIEAITSEKAAIITGGKAFTTNSDPQILAILDQQSKKVSAQLFIMHDYFDVIKYRSDKNTLSADIRVGTTNYTNITFNTLSALQVKNFSVALALVETLGFYLSDSVIRAAALNGPVARFERIHDFPTIYFDCAHNMAAIKESLDLFVTFAGKKHLYLSLMKDKSVDLILTYLNYLNIPFTYLLLDDQRAYIPPDGRLSTLSIQNIKMIATSLEKDYTYLFCGTFRLYQYMVDIINQCPIKRS